MAKFRYCWGIWGILGMSWSSAIAALPSAYPAMAPLAQYMSANPSAEIALARSAAPPALSKDAAIMVLGASGYQQAVAGKNGFVCLVLRSWTAGFKDPIFWNRKVRGPACYNPAAVRSVLPQILERAKWVVAGLSIPDMVARAGKSAAANMVPEAGAFALMMSRQGYVQDKGEHAWHPHLMFYQAHAKAADWGANLPGSPVFAAEDSPVTVYFVPLPKWSDGTPAMTMP